MNDRSGWVDYAKGIGIILVVYGHVARGVEKSGLPMDQGAFELVDSVIYSFHMPLFFFLSGLFFLSSLSKHGGKGLVLSKVDTIIYPYLLWSLLQGSVEVLMSRYTNGDTSFGEVLQLLWHPRAQFWFLYSLFFVFISLIWVATKLGRYWLYTATLVSIALYFFSGSVPRLGQMIFGFAIFFVFGVLFQAVSEKVHRSAGIASLALGVAFILVQYWFHVRLELTYEDGGLPALLVALVSILFVVTFSMFLGRWRIGWLSLLGVSSMTIYLLHILAGSGTRIVLSFFSANSTTTSLVLGVAVGLIGPLIAGRLFNVCGFDFLLSPPKRVSARVMFNLRGQDLRVAPVDRP